MPSNTTPVAEHSSLQGKAFSMFFYVYVLESLKDGDLYIGYTNNLNRRIKEHNAGLNFSTKFRLSFKLIYSEACLNSDDAKRREHYLKTTQGRRFLGIRLNEYKLSKKFSSES